MCEADLLQPLQLDVLWGFHLLGNAREGGDDVGGAVALVPDLVHRAKGALGVLLQAGLQAALHLLGLGLVIHPEDRRFVDFSEGVEGRLRSVKGVAHVSLCGESQGFQTRLVVRGALLLQHQLQSLKHFLVGYPAETKDRAAGLDGFDDLRRDVARQGKARGLAEDLHRPTHGLLRSLGHAVCFVQNNYLQLAFWQGNLLLREALDLFPHDVDASVIRGVQLDAALLVVLFQVLPGEAVHHRGLATAGRTGEEQVGEGACGGMRSEDRHGSRVADHILELDGSVLLQPYLRHGLFSQEVLPIPN
mmetsp:Transcript_72508/g.169967  ORF Transcript_72508/g.169967 Transcript_72508/m.169967 type:complete len:304 (+) Transcript_72508:174-1085(+)